MYHPYIYEGMLITEIKQELNLNTESPFEGVYIYPCSISPTSLPNSNPTSSGIRDLQDHVPTSHHRHPQPPSSHRRQAAVGR